MKDGARVAVLDVDEERGNALVSELEPEVIFCNTDVTDERSVQDAIDKAAASFASVHVAINCAGVGPAAKILGKRGLMPLEDFTKVVDINLFGTFNVMRYAAQKMIQNSPDDDCERGVIINTASIAAFEGQTGQAVYSASKAGVCGSTLPAAREFAEYGLRVIAVLPGLFETPMAAISGLHRHLTARAGQATQEA